MNMKGKMQQYQSVGVQTSIMDADPHRLIQLLFSGALDNLAAAKGYMEHQNIEQRNHCLNKTIHIVGGLRNFLDEEKGGEVSANLDRLYEYVEHRLFQANVKNDLEGVEECIGLIKQVADAWGEIRPKAQAAESSSVAG
jgi:flagellar protein FliS